VKSGRPTLAATSRSAQPGNHKFEHPPDRREAFRIGLEELGSVASEAERRMAARVALFRELGRLACLEPSREPPAIRSASLAFGWPFKGTRTGC
jgi:hypothetical protein